MTFWNLLVVLCFAVLYAGLVLVFLQLRRLRDEIRIHHTDNTFPEPSFGGLPPHPALREGEQDRLESVQQGLEELGQGLLEVGQGLVEVRNQLHALRSGMLESLAAQLQPEFDAIQRQLNYLAHQPAAGGAGLGSASAGAQDRDAAYQNARMLLANGVDEDRVVDETGLAMEEVSLLKRLMMQQQGGG